MSTMHSANGVEFRAVAPRRPPQPRSASATEVYDTERHLLYVACTRARDYLLVTSVAPASEFLDDLPG
jgi:superfamily I DNA/RNA helicase